MSTDAGVSPFGRVTIGVRRRTNLLPKGLKQWTPPSRFELVEILLIFTATFSWINIRLALLPHILGLLVMGLGASLSHPGFEAGIIADLMPATQLAVDATPVSQAQLGTQNWEVTRGAKEAVRSVGMAAAVKPVRRQ